MPNATSFTDAALFIFFSKYPSHIQKHFAPLKQLWRFQNIDWLRYVYHAVYFLKEQINRVLLFF